MHNHVEYQNEKKKWHTYYYDQRSIVFRKDRIAFPTLEARAHLAKQHLELVLDWWWSWLNKLLMPVAGGP